MKLCCLLVPFFGALALAGPTGEKGIHAEERRASCAPGVPILNGNPKATLEPQIKLFAVDPTNATRRFPVGSPLNPLPDTFIFPFQALPVGSKRAGIFILQDNTLYGNGQLSTYSNGTNPLAPSALYLASDTRATSATVQVSNACVGGKVVRALVFAGPTNVSLGGAVTKKPLAGGVKLFKPLLPLLNTHEVVLEVQEI